MSDGRQSYEAAALKPGREQSLSLSRSRKHAAAKGAAALLQKHSVPLLIGRKSQFVRLAALLYGREGPICAPSAAKCVAGRKAQAGTRSSFLVTPLRYAVIVSHRANEVYRKP